MLAILEPAAAVCFFRVDEILSLEQTLVDDAKCFLVQYRKSRLGEY